MTFLAAKSLPFTKTLQAICWSVLIVVCGMTLVQGEERRRLMMSMESDFGPPPDRYELVERNSLIRRNGEWVAPDFELRQKRGRDPSGIQKSTDDLLELYQKRNKPRLDPVRLPGLEPVAPSSPVRHPSAANLDQSITRRYQDPRVIRVLTELTTTTGEAFYREVSQMIDSRHIEPSSYAQRIHDGMEHLKVAVSNAAFQQAAGINPTSQQIRMLRVQLEELQQSVVVRNSTEALQALRQAARMSQQAVGLNPGAVCFEFVYASLDSLDKFSMLLPPEKSGQVNVGLDENIVGIGVEVASDQLGLKIVKTIPGGPAADAALKSGDLITAVNGRSLQNVEMGLAVDLITGRPGTPVKLSLQRNRLVADVTLVRRAVTVNSISEVRMLDENAHVGYIKLEQFAESSARELDEAMWKLHNAGMESLVFDLRGNPGGYLTTAIDISDRFLPAGTIVSTRGRTPDDNTNETAKYAQTWKTPLVVLIDHNSASASEIFAAAIQDNSRGLIVGETSYGKGTVQSLFPLNSVTAGLRLTTAKFYSPQGRAMAGEGVTPDIRVRTGTADDDAEILQAALEATRDPRLPSMAAQRVRPNRTGMRTIQVAASEK